MKLQYRISDGDNVTMWCGSVDYKAPEGYQAVDVEFGVPSESLSYFIFNGSSLVRKEQSVIDTMIVLQNFNAEKAIGREAQVFSASDLIRLMPYSYTLNELIRFKNFSGGVANGVSYDGLKQVAQGLVSAGAILQSDYDKLASILLEQGIVL